MMIMMLKRGVIYPVLFKCLGEVGPMEGLMDEKKKVICSRSSSSSSSSRQDVCSALYLHIH